MVNGFAPGLVDLSQSRDDGGSCACLNYAQRRGAGQSQNNVLRDRAARGGIPLKYMDTRAMQ
jgi:hypothetical protein